MPHESSPLSALLVPGHHHLTVHHFGLGDEIAQRMVQVGDEFLNYCNTVLAQVEETGDAGLVCECCMTKVIIRLVDTLVKPQTKAEEIWSTWTASRMLYDMMPRMLEAVNQLTMAKHQSVTYPTFNGSTNATA